jgi:hypothetical protein
MRRKDAVQSFGLESKQRFFRRVHTTEGKNHGEQRSHGDGLVSGPG